jgi:hypothetical protein
MGTGRSFLLMASHLLMASQTDPYNKGKAVPSHLRNVCSRAGSLASGLRKWLEAAVEEMRGSLFRQW